MHIDSATNFNHTLFAALFHFVGTSTNVGRTRQLNIPCLGSSSKLSFEGVLVTQGLVYIPPGVALDKTPSGRKFTIGRLTSSILNPSSLMLTELQKSPTSFDSFEKDVSLWSESREKELDCWETSVKMQLMLRQRPAYKSSKNWISVTHKVIIQLILPWPCSRPQLLRVLEMSPPPTPKRLWLSTSPHTPCIHIRRSPTIAV